jgi:hypothetical protein
VLFDERTEFCVRFLMVNAENSCDCKVFIGVANKILTALTQFINIVGCAGCQFSLFMRKACLTGLSPKES